MSPSANLTAQTDLTRVKWRHWFAVQPGDPPVMKNPDCTRFDARPNPFGDDHLAGLFESSHYFCGWFRPTYQCRMRRAATEFCPVCLEAMHASLSTYASPVQTFDLVVPGGGTTLEFGAVPAGTTVTRSFEVRNVRSPGAWPSALNVTVSIAGAQFAFAPGAEVTFKIPAPIEQTAYSRTVEVSFTAPAGGTQEFNGQVTAPATLNLHATAVRPTVDVGVLAIDPQHRSAYVDAIIRRDFVAAMKAVFQVRHLLGAIDFPHDSGVPTSPAALDAVKARFFADFPLTGYATFVAYLSLAGDPGAGSAAVRDARRGTVSRVTWTFPGGGGSITSGSFEVGPEAMEVARQNGVTNSALIVVEPSPMTVSTAVLALDPQHGGAYLTAVQRQDHVGAMREVLRVRRMLGQVDFPHDSAVPTSPTLIPRVRSRFLAEFPRPTKTLVTYYSRVGQVGSGSVAIRDSRRELVRTATWTATSGGVGSIANASFEVGPDVFQLATEHGFPYDAIMVVHPFPE